jgi:hypothetical protein
MFTSRTTNLTPGSALTLVSPSRPPTAKATSRLGFQHTAIFSDLALTRFRSPQQRQLQINAAHHWSEITLEMNGGSDAKDSLKSRSAQQGARYDLTTARTLRVSSLFYSALRTLSFPNSRGKIPPQGAGNLPIVIKTQTSSSSRQQRAHLRECRGQQHLQPGLANDPCFEKTAV